MVFRPRFSISRPSHINVNLPGQFTGPIYRDRAQLERWGATKLCFDFVRDRKPHLEVFKPKLRVRVEGLDRELSGHRS